LDLKDKEIKIGLTCTSVVNVTTGREEGRKKRREGSKGY
jgi:hypothetical protein